MYSLCSSGGRRTCGTLINGSLIGGLALFPQFWDGLGRPPLANGYTAVGVLGHLSEADTPSSQKWGGGQWGTPWSRNVEPKDLLEI